MYTESDGTVESPLSLKEIQTIEDTSLSNTDKHYLRLLAHCLACLKMMANQSETGCFPNEVIRTKWLLKNNRSLIDEKFLNAFLIQLKVAEETLGNIANTYEISPLELTLEHLIDFLKNDLNGNIHKKEIF